MNTMDKMKLVEQAYVRTDIADFTVGDTVIVYTKIREGADKVRLHPFQGVVIAKQGKGLNAAFSVRKVTAGEGVERIFPLNCRAIERVEVLKSGKVKRAKLYYLRGKVGKRATKIETREVVAPKETQVSG
jgi:large subunit ribosomal protein L19